MSFPKLEQLRVTLEQLKPAAHTETARLGWSQIAHIAGTYYQMITPGVSLHQAWKQVIAGKEIGPSKASERKTTYELEQELRALADAARKFRDALEAASPQCCALLAEVDGPNDNYFSEWFWIPQSWRGEERDPTVDTDDVHADQVSNLAAELEQQAFFLSLRKEAPKGPRKENMQHAAKETLLSSLQQLVGELGRSKKHADSIARAIQEWATSAPVKRNWGKQASVRARKQASSTIEA
jgi:hypothetical protein